MFAIHAINHASFIVADTGCALQFYCEVLGLQQDQTRPDLGYPGAWLNIGSSTTQQIHLLELPNPDPVNGRPDHGGRDRHVAFYVQGLEALCRKLDDHGQAYSRSKSGRAAVFVRDPDGNALELIEQAQNT